MATYRVSYRFQDPNNPGYGFSNSITVTAESEDTAIRIAEQKIRANNSQAKGKDFLLTAEVKKI